MSSKYLLQKIYYTLPPYLLKSFKVFLPVQKSESKPWHYLFCSFRTNVEFLGKMTGVFTHYTLGFLWQCRPASFIIAMYSSSLFNSIFYDNITCSSFVVTELKAIFIKSKQIFLTSKSGLIFQNNLWHGQLHTDPIFLGKGFLFDTYSLHHFSLMGWDF